jgi:type IV pilus assembly protein PilV
MSVRNQIRGFCQQQFGMTLIELMVTVFILAVGLLGMAGLQSRLQQSEMEAYQRSQALILLQDMTSRIAVNRNNAASYVTNNTGLGGAGVTCPTATGTQPQRDAVEWCNAVQGAGETSGTSKVGAMIGGRGCVQAMPGGDYLVTVAWQGIVPLVAPPVGVPCGANLYSNASNCIGDICRRVVTTIVRIATL